MNAKLVERAIEYGSANDMSYATRVLLIVLASIADDFGEVQISMPALEREYSMGRAGTKNAIARLTEMGVLEVESTDSLLKYGRLFTIHL